VDLLVSQGQKVSDAIRQTGVSEVTFYRWRQEFGGLKTDRVKRLRKNSRLGKAVSDLTLDELILTEAARKLLSPARRCVCIDITERTCKSPSAAPVRRWGTVSRSARSREDTERLTADVVATRQYGRHGYREKGTLLRQAAWAVRNGRLERDLAAAGS
jgi:putative transposase